MPAQIVFLTLLLGLTSGVQPVDLHVEGPIKTVRILSGERELAHLNAPPWHARIDLGPLAPQELVAIGLDGDGNEIARTSQWVNLPRPTAEFEIALKNQEKRTIAELRWHHLMNLEPKHATISVDGKSLTVDPQFRASLPQLDAAMPHVLTAEMRFDDGFVARKELVIEGTRSYSAGAELTPVLVREQRAGTPAATQLECFSARGVALRANAIEKPDAQVIVVQDPFPAQAVATLWTLRTARLHPIGELDSDVKPRIIWPIASAYGDGESTATLFERSPDLGRRNRAMSSILTFSLDEPLRVNEARRYTDAVAVAGLQAMVGGLRRAVVFVLGNHDDVSQYDPQSVRRYLARIGVPLFVWSVAGPRPDLARTWGDVEDVSTPDRLLDATKRLREVLDQQRVAWLAVDPLTALRVEVKPDCGLQPTR